MLMMLPIHPRTVGRLSHHAEDDPRHSSEAPRMRNLELVRAMRDGDWNACSARSFRSFNADPSYHPPRAPCRSTARGSAAFSTQFPPSSRSPCIGAPPTARCRDMRARRLLPRVGTA